MNPNERLDILFLAMTKDGYGLTTEQQRAVRATVHDITKETN